ncbi:MAG: hypothetical protein KJ724_06325, partial [Proteobacteria bacterium]|nr:hypothetical protein [Pseudomonadota bacterium]
GGGEASGDVHGDKSYTVKKILSTKTFIRISWGWSLIPYNRATGGHFSMVPHIDIFCRKCMFQKCI